MFAFYFLFQPIIFLATEILKCQPQLTPHTSLNPVSADLVAPITHHLPPPDITENNTWIISLSPFPSLPLPAILLFLALNSFSSPSWALLVLVLVSSGKPIVLNYLTLYIGVCVRIFQTNLDQRFKLSSEQKIFREKHKDFQNFHQNKIKIKILPPLVTSMWGWWSGQLNILDNKMSALLSHLFAGLALPHGVL